VGGSGSGRRATSSGATGDTTVRTRRNALLIGGAIAAALAVMVVFFLVGLAVGGGSADPGGPASAERTAPASTAAPSPLVSPSPATSSASSASSPAGTPPADSAAGGENVDAAPPGPLAPGVHDWNALHGGECLSGYSSPWELQFTVVDCSTEHNAQLVSKGAFPEDAATPYPGEPALASRLNLLCTAPAVLNYAAAGELPDVQWQAAYPADDAQWTSGDRAYFCFYSRSSGQPLGGSLAAVPAG
jgi:hypothetical protein